MGRRQTYFFDKATLEEMYQRTGSAIATAKALGVSKRTILRNLKRFGITPHTLRKVTPDVEIDIVRSAQAGKTVTETADRLGLDRSTIQEYAKRHGVKFFDPYHVGFITTWNGYRKVWNPEHPAADARGYVMQHVLVAEEAIGRMLQPGEVVHHKDGRKTNNVPSNLEVMRLSEHASLHARRGETGFAVVHRRRKI